MIKVSQVTEKSEGDIIFTPHCHSTIEVDYFIEGSGRYSVAGTEHSISLLWRVPSGNTLVYTLL